MIQNLGQLKKELKTCPRLEITGHLRQECVGQIRRVTLVNTRCLYSAVEGRRTTSSAGLMKAGVLISSGARLMPGALRTGSAPSMSAAWPIRGSI